MSHRRETNFKKRERVKDGRYMHWGICHLLRLHGFDCKTRHLDWGVEIRIMGEETCLESILGGLATLKTELTGRVGYFRKVCYIEKVCVCNEIRCFRFANSMGTTFFEQFPRKQF